MSQLPEEIEFERLLQEFAGLISGKIRSFDHGRYGIDGDDLLQEVRLRLWRACEVQGRRRGIRDLRAYISRIVFSTVINEIEKERTQRKACERQTAVELAAPPEPAADEADAECGLPETISRALLRLPRRYAEVIRLRLQDFTFEEIARLRDSSVDQARHLFYRGVEKMKGMIDDERGMP